MLRSKINGGVVSDQAFELLLEKFRDADKRLDTIDEKMDELLSFKWKIIGGSVVISTLFTFLVSVLMKVAH